MIRVDVSVDVSVDVTFVRSLAMGYDVEAIRKKLKQSQSGKFVDPDEFKPGKATSTNEPDKYRFFVLPPFDEGVQLKSGVTKTKMDQFFIQHGNHWVNDRPHACPRVWDGSDCQICNFGFDLLRDEKDEDKRRSIIKQWMPTTYYVVNLYFPNWDKNPEDLRGKVKWYNAPKTCFDIWTACLMREGPGDPDEPEAWGVFFDESAGFLFELNVLKQGKQNSYKTSKFLSQKGVGIPMARNPDGSPNAKGLATLLKLRHDLFSKVEIPDPEKIQRLYRVMAEGDDPDEVGGFDHDETKEPKPESKPKQKSESKPKSEPKPKSESKKMVDDDDIIDSGPVDSDSVDSESDLIDEKPLVEDLVESPESTDSKSDVGSDEIESLLSQLDDDD